MEEAKPSKSMTTVTTLAAGSVDKDAALLATLGYRQELKRNFSPLELFGIGFSIIGLVPSLASVLVYSIPYGGASAMVWGWTVCGVFLTMIALAMAELGSAAPTSGGLYYWTFMFSTPRWRCLLSWIVGYCNSIGNIASVASVDWGCAVQIMAAASINSGLEFEATTAQTYGVFTALLLTHATICSFNPVIIARLQIPYIIINVLLCLAILIAVPASTPKAFVNTSSYAFGNFTNVSGWNNGYAFILSFLSPLWAVAAFDSMVHISEEATNADIAIPFAIIFSTTVSVVVGWGLNVALAFCMGKDTENILSSPIGQPMATILFNSLGQRGTLAVWAFIIVVQFTMGTSMLTACSRQMFAFSRDGALPFSRYLYHVNRRTFAPVNCVWASAFIAMLLGLLAFAGTAAIGAVFSLVVAGQYVAYSIPIAARFLGGQEVRKGRFTLGKLSMPVAAIAVTFMLFIVVVFLFPASPRPDPAGMNYTVVVLGGTLFLAVTYFYFPKYGGVHWFNGPVSTLEGGTISPDRENEKLSESPPEEVQEQK